MGITYEDLDGTVRQYMVKELDRDIESHTIYLSERLNESGVSEWIKLLREAIQKNDDDWLATQIRLYNLLNPTYQRKNLKGGLTFVKMPVNAPETLAEGEFNRFFVRGLCAQVIATGGTEVEVYRGKDVSQPRSESEMMIGQQISAKKLLEDLRTSQGVEPAVGLPSGPNSGLTVRRLKL